MTTLYTTLGVAPDATLDEIKRAYRRAAMKWHPDRNLGRETEAHAAFQEIRDAYTILSDAGQRQIYDEVFEREMRRWQAEREAQEEQEREAQRESQRIAQEHYEKMLGIAMRFADDGHNRDVIFGVLLGRDCEAELASRIADSIWALQESRRASARDAHAPDTEAAQAPDGAAASNPDEETRPRRHAGAFDSFWHGLFGIRS
ncbi:DnaJ-class molecular chaperone with C-terminal Zn finger domain [Cupriavidus necator]|uniref:DnaJ-class molecular chaperone n=1 Tax=Cupriavidus necator (strain ATCC 17699 / DSM 428 / KCTC 22496 / NCIMB 10442 / H16 / Stanier 337) TaxID=381666 RepID=Q0KB69_CUPNH|nr:MULTISPECIES: J domain-containing protein [Cupriavidus]EON19180.1 DnaJ-class molecular chaperone [Cupriavidus sp. GA3-3]KUE88634.1 molecular chaperone DnaJ [Cupriavidus necator]QCC00621.1 J domain-containing protein [Cupriavidus necator H16]QQB76555.1 J domain-containing protein [Cupriavidus necator]WKA42489.1 J domain-containing protein [Cupriavidus necator]